MFIIADWALTDCPSQRSLEAISAGFPDSTIHRRCHYILSSNRRTKGHSTLTRMEEAGLSCIGSFLAKDLSVATLKPRCELH